MLPGADLLACVLRPPEQIGATMAPGHLGRLNQQMDLRSLLGVRLVGVLVLCPGVEESKLEPCILTLVSKPLLTLPAWLREKK